MEIRLENLCKAFDGKPVIRDISLCIRDHSLTTLLGMAMAVLCMVLTTGILLALRLGKGKSSSGEN